jgi:hypothetical protein
MVFSAIGSTGIDTVMFSVLTCCEGGRWWIGVMALAEEELSLHETHTRDSHGEKPCVCVSLLFQSFHIEFWSECEALQAPVM